MPSAAALMFAAAASSIAITCGIVGDAYVYESASFFGHVSLVDFLTDTMWTPLFADAALRHFAAGVRARSSRRPWRCAIALADRHDRRRST